MDLELEVKRLQELRSRHAAKVASTVKSREEVAKCIREIGEAYIEHALNPESHAEKEMETLCKKLEAQRAKAQGEVDRLTLETEALTAVIRRTEIEIVPLYHVSRLERQQEVRGHYRDLCARLIDAANTLADLNLQARDAFQSAEREFRTDELCAGHDTVLRYAGLRPVFDAAWLSLPGASSRRDLFVGRVYDFARDLVAESDPVTISKRHQEDHFRKECERHEAERRKRMGDCGITEPVKFRNATPLERQTGEWTPDNPSVRHPLSPLGLAENLGLIKRVS